MVKKVESVVQSFKDNVVIVTGAGKGIGRATAIELAHRGAKVIAMARTLSDLESLNTQIASSSIDVDLSNANDAGDESSDWGGFSCELCRYECFTEHFRYD